MLGHFLKKVWQVLPFSAMFYVCHEITKYELAGKHTKLISESLMFYCYYVLATVYPISFICWTVNLNSVINC